MSEFDVLVAGAGPAGCATAASLCRAGLRVLLVAGARSPRCWAGESLPPGIGELAASVFGTGILASPPHRVAYGTRAAWGSSTMVDTDFIANPLGTGWQLDRPLFDAQALISAVRQGASVAENRNVIGLTRRSGGWRISLSAGHAANARWVVDATGRNGAVVRHLGVKRIRRDRQVAQLALLPATGDAFSGTTVEAVAEGWWYVTPLPNGQRVLAYLTDSDLLPPRSRRQQEWHDLLAATVHIAGLAGAAAARAAPRIYPADTAYRTPLTGKRWTAVGDAAMSLDPMSSQGIATGILMGARAGMAIAEELLAENPTALEAWERDYRMLLDEHETMRAYYASAEERWPESVFWTRRRHGIKTESESS